MNGMYNPATPGELLREFIGERSIGVARATISRILNGHTAVTVDLSIRLGEALSPSPDFCNVDQTQSRSTEEHGYRRCAPKKRFVSAEAKEKMAAAQKARWAKVKRAA
jgi:antitoxin HigA-1